MRSTVSRGARHFSYVPLLGLAAVVSFAKLLVYAQLIGVEAFGSLSKMLLVSSAFGMVGSLGLQSVVSRDLPALFARGRVRRGLWLLARTAALTTLVAAVSLTAILLGLRVFDLSSEELALGLVHGWSQQIFLLAAFESRSRLDMTRYARGMVLRSTAVAVAGAAAAGFGTGAAGIALVEMLLTLLFFALTSHRAMRFANLSWAWFIGAASRRAAPMPWTRAMLLMAGTIVLFVSLNVDRWVAADLLTKPEFGQYAFAWLALVVAQSIQGLLNSSLLPLLAQRRAHGQQASAYRLTRLLTLSLLLAGAVALAPMLWGLNQLVRSWMPQYAAALPLLLPLLLAGLFRMADFWSSLLIVIGRESTLLKGQSAAVVATLAGYAVHLHLSASAPTPLSLAWLAAACALASHGVSAASVMRSARRTEAQTVPG